MSNNIRVLTIFTTVTHTMNCFFDIRIELLFFILIFSATETSKNDTDSFSKDQNSVTTRSTNIKIMLISVSSIGIPANIVCGSVIFATPLMRKKPFNMFILHQSFVDLMACLATFLVQFFDDITVFSHPVLAEIYCRVWVATSFMWMTIITSTFNLTAMTLERYRAITKPLQYDETKVRRRIPFICIFVWLLGFIIFSPDIIFSRIQDGECRANIAMGNDMYKFFFCFWMCTNVIIPTSIMLTCYAHMAYVLNKSVLKFSKDKSVSVKEDNRQIKMKSAQNNVLQTGFILVVVYVICWTYLTGINALIVFRVLENFSGIEWNIALVLVLGNSVINPLVYSFRYHEFQEAAIAILKRLFLSKTNIDV